MKANFDNKMIVAGALFTGLIMTGIAPLMMLGGLGLMGSGIACLADIVD